MSFAGRARPAPPLRGETLAAGLTVGLFGGSFNPVHDGHRHVADTAMKRLGLDRVWWLVSPGNPLKDPAGNADYAVRFEAVRRAADAPRQAASDVERRLGLRFTLDALRALKRRHPDVRFVWIMGADNLGSIHRWRDWRKIFAAVPIVVIARPGDALRARLGPAARTFARSRMRDADASVLAFARPPAWIYLTARLNPASSTALRREPGPARR